jgi:hypothetical protein
MLNVFICCWTLKMFKFNGWWVLLPSVIYFHMTTHPWSSYSIVLLWTLHILLDQSMIERSRTWDSPKTNDASMWIVGDSLTVLDFSSSAMIKVCIGMTPISWLIIQNVEVISSWSIDIWKNCLMFLEKRDWSIIPRYHFFSSSLNALVRMDLVKSQKERYIRSFTKFRKQ